MLMSERSNILPLSDQTHWFWHQMVFRSFDSGIFF